MKNLEYKVHLGFPDVFFIIFLVLKLTDNIDWSWWWVFSPILIAVTIQFILKSAD